jgi:hypothetical protein
MDREIKRWTAHRTSALALDNLQAKTAVSKSFPEFNFPPSEIEFWIDQAKSGMENALKEKPEEIREQYKSQLKTPQDAYGDAILELCGRKKRTPCWPRRTRHDPSDPA